MEAVLDFGRGCQNLAVILRGVWGGAEIERRLAPCYHIYRGGGVRGGGGGLATVCTPHVCSPLSRSSFSLLHSAVEASFDIKKACGKPYKLRHLHACLGLCTVSYLA
jgi:hypothetical protein